MSGPAWVDFHSVQGILLLRLMSRCNERCVFCMVEDEIEGSADVDFRAAVEAIAAQPEGTIIEFFGGEPTIYPHFLELVTEARARGFYCSIASNARIFHSRDFTRKMAATGREHLYVRTSLYGDEAGMHDALTRARMSFDQTAKGVQNLLDESILTQVNIVIMKENYRNLAGMVDLVHSWNVPRIKFGNLMGISTCMAQAVSLAAVKPHLEAAIAQAEALGLRVTVEKTPLCCAGGRIDLLSTEREAFGGARSFDDDGACGTCLVRRWCDGLDPDYARAFGYGDLVPLSQVPANGLIDGARPLPEPELLRTYCVTIPDEEAVTADLGDRLAQVLTKIRARHGRFAIFPRRFVHGSAQAQRV